MSTKSGGSSRVGFVNRPTLYDVCVVGRRLPREISCNVIKSSNMFRSCASVSGVQFCFHFLVGQPNVSSLLLVTLYIIPEVESSFYLQRFDECLEASINETQNARGGVVLALRQSDDGHGLVHSSENHHERVIVSEPRVSKGKRREHRVTFSR
jgi:hypothetical protein